jgi:hypothetical protein
MFPCNSGGLPDFPAFSKGLQKVERELSVGMGPHSKEKKETHRNACLSTGALKTRKACVLSWVSIASQSAQRSMEQYAQRYHFPTIFPMCRSQSAKACVRYRR